MFKLNHLPHRQRDEEVIFLLRRDTFVLFRMLLGYIFLLILPILLRVLTINYTPNLLPDGEISSIVLTLIAFGYYLYIILFFYRSWLDYYLDVWIVTNRRVLSVELQGLFNRIVSEHKLFRIQDVTTEQKGLLANFLNYGDVHIQTAGTKERFVFEQVSEPEKVAQKVVQLIEWNKKAYPDEK